MVSVTSESVERKCPRCATVNAPDALLCSTCGKPLRGAGMDLPAADSKLNSNGAQAGGPGRAAPARMDGPPFLPEPAPLRPLPDSEPMTLPLMARLFGVPLLIVSLIIGAAVVVVLLFGRIAAEPQRTIDELLTVIETPHGEKMMGIALMPRDKEVWQAARELSLRLERMDVELQPGELGLVVSRLTALCDRIRADSGGLSEAGLAKMSFVVSALARTRDTGAVPPLVRCLDAPRWEVRRDAVHGLASMHEVPDVHDQAVGAIAKMVVDDEEPVVRTVAAYALSFVARPDDRVALEQLQRACEALDEDREVVWNAALSLARLGSGAGRGVLLDMLDRQYWETKAPLRVPTAGGQVVETAMTEDRVEAYLVTAIEAASHLNDETVWAQVAALEGDKSIRVVAKVREVLARRPAEEPG